jgi:predicted dehydrogenase
LGVVDTNAAAADRLFPPRPFFRSFTQAIAAWHPDFIINATPPSAHTAINLEAFKHRIAVLCEKPIAENYAEAARVVKAASVFQMEMSNGVTVSFAGSLASNGPPTDWTGTWRIECSRRTFIVGNRMLHTGSGRGTITEDFKGVRVTWCMDDFLSALKSGKEPETSGRDYLKTQYLLHCAVESANSHRVVNMKRR